jgi:murein L,D-transpeptidase YcbB/YkuD
LTIILVGLGALHVAMHQLGPPPIDSAGHLLPTAAIEQSSTLPPKKVVALDPDAVDQRYLAMLFAFEDRRFYWHFGVDPVGIARAVRDLVHKRRIVTGGSTLTMQVARLIDNKYQRSPSVKLRQIVRAIQLEQSLTKSEILSLYLALAPFGGATKGVRAACLKYFGKEPRQLSIAQAALLVALPQAPEARRLDRHAGAARRARNFVIDTVTAAGVLTPQEATIAKLEPLIPESLEMPPAPLPKPSNTQVASIFAGLTLGINIVAGAAVASPMEPEKKHFLGSGEQIVLDVRHKLLKPQPSGTHQKDRDALWMFYAGRSEPVWVSKTGWTPKAKAVIDELNRADDWGLDAADFEIPALPTDTEPSQPLSQEKLADAETDLSLAVMKYARYARGGRIADPTSQLSTYLDRKPQVRPPFLVMTAIAADDAPDSVLRKLNPQHEQFARLRQLYLDRRDSAASTVVDIPSSSKLKPGTTHPNIALVRERLRVPAAGEDGNFYDDRLVDAVKHFQTKHGIEPANGVINTKTRRALNEGQSVSLAALLANMEQWRWMPDDLGETYVWVNIPEYMVRVVKDGQVIHSERVIVGEVDKQTPIFSEDLKTIYFHPRWNVPESIKVNEIGPAIARGRRRDMVVMRNGKVIKPSSVNWYKADIRNYDVFQPSGPGNALGLMKFTFPNKHAVYLHDTQSKGLFSSEQRTFSHGCVRVRNPQRLAEVLLSSDKGWTPDDVAKLVKVKGEPTENAVDLDKHIPVHITYFTAEVDADGEVNTQSDVYGHEKRITQALKGKWNDIDKGADHLAQQEMARRLDDTSSAKRSNQAGRRTSGAPRRAVARSSGGGGGGSSTRISSSGSSANDIFRRSFGN